MSGLASRELISLTSPSAHFDGHCGARKMIHILIGRKIGSLEMETNGVLAIAF
jgi:hypothetical protein